MFLYTPAGEINPFGNGAAKRSAQISSLLNRHFPIKNTQDIQYSFFPRIQKYHTGYKILKKNKITIHSAKQIASAGHHYCNLEKISDLQPPDEKIWFWESTLLDYFLKPLFYYDLGFKMFAFPHNLESLVPGQQSALSGLASPQWLNEELNQLRLCNHVFTISEEEQWLLSLFNIDGTWFPYYPPAEAEKELLEIRDYRMNHHAGEFFLMVGSFYYEPIQNGLLDLLQYLNQTNSKINLKITGFGSELIPGKLNFKLPGNIDIVGAASTSKLQELQKSCRAVIINQSASSGALTKIRELQIAGVPVIANNASTRSYDHFQGLYPFSSFDELEILVKSDLKLPDLPENNSAFEERVVKIISDKLL